MACYAGVASAREAGLDAALAFRKEMLADDRADAVGRLIERFAEQYAAPISDRPSSGRASSNRPSLSAFAVTADAFSDQLRRGDAIDPEAAFAPFAGSWFGVWDGKRVDHQWSGVGLAPPSGSDAGLIATQKAWIGDGWGWNYLYRSPSTDRSVSLAPPRAPRAAALEEVVLGYVEMLHHQDPHGDPTAIASVFPLVAYYDGPGRLIWVTPSSVYFEEVFGPRDGERYAITGCDYRLSPRGEAAIVGGGFQAVYTRDPAVRPPWLRFAAE